MTERVFVDTNVFLYARDDRFPEKQARAQLWLDILTKREAAVVSPQVIGEIHNVVLRGKLPISADAARRTTRALESWSFGATDLELIQQAWAVREETAFQWWDCVILAAAIQAGCLYLLSEDFQHGRTVHGTTILNPFSVGPEAVATEH